MRLTRRIVTIAASVMCALALAACGKQVVAHVTASDIGSLSSDKRIHQPDDSVLVTVQVYPGRPPAPKAASSVVITTSHDQGTSTSSSMTNQSIDLSSTICPTLWSICAQWTGRHISASTSRTSRVLPEAAGFAAESKTLDQLAARPGFGFIHDALLGDWIGVSTSTLTSVIRQLEPQMAGGLSSISGIQSSISSIQSSISRNPEGKRLGQQVTSSWRSRSGHG